MRPDLSSMPTYLQVVFGVLIAIQLVLMLTALVILLRTPSSRLALPKLAWAAIIVLVNVFGPIAFLIGGRKKDTPVVEAPVNPTSHTTAEAAIDELYRS